MNIMEVYVIYEHDQDSVRCDIIGIFQDEQEALEVVRNHYGLIEPDYEWDGFFLFETRKGRITIEPYLFNKLRPS